MVPAPHFDWAAGHEKKRSTICVVCLTTKCEIQLTDNAAR